jgi:heat shock protein HslJ
MRPAIEGPDRRSLVVDRVIRTRPGTTCDRRPVTAELVNTYWRLDSLAGAGVEREPGAQEPHLVLFDGDAPRYAATVGCNRLGGSFARDGGTLSFGAGLSTMMACPPPLDTLERGLSAALDQVRAFSISGETMSLTDGDGDVVALFTAVYTRRD